MNSIVEKFCRIVLHSKNPQDEINEWEFWRKEKHLSDKIIIAGPSIIVGLVDLKKIEENISWESYCKRLEPTKKMTGNFVYKGIMFGTRFLRDAYPLLDEVVDVGVYKESLMFKLNEDVAFCMGCKRTNEDFYYNEEGVMFVELNFDEIADDWKTVTKAKEFIKWKDGIAKRKHSSKASVWYEEVYKFEKFFDENEDEGDFMLL